MLDFFIPVDDITIGITCAAFLLPQSTYFIYDYYHFYCYSICMSLITGLFFLVLLLKQRWSPPLRLQTSHCSILHIMCDVPSIAVFCSEPIKFLPGTASKIFLKLLITIPVASIITGITYHFRFHIRRISIQKLLYFNLFFASFCTAFLSRGMPLLSVCIFSLIRF